MTTTITISKTIQTPAARIPAWKLSQNPELAAETVDKHLYTITGTVAEVTENPRSMLSQIITLTDGTQITVTAGIGADWSHLIGETITITDAAEHEQGGYKANRTNITIHEAAEEAPAEEADSKLTEWTHPTTGQVRRYIDTTALADHMPSTDSHGNRYSAADLSRVRAAKIWLDEAGQTHIENLSERGWISTDDIRRYVTDYLAN